MHLGRRARSLAGPILLLWVTVLAIISIHVQAEGPYWGISLGETRNGDVVVAEIDRQGAAWGNHIHLGTPVLRIGDVDARTYAGRPVPRVDPILYVDDEGVERTARVLVPWSFMLGLLVSALICAYLAAIVFRWAPDPVLGGLFLLFTGSTATVLASIPFGLPGYTWGLLFLSAIMAPISSASLLLFALYFPRPTRWARQVTLGTAIVTGMLVVITTWFYVQRTFPTPTSPILAAWEAVCVVGGLLLLLGRILDPSSRPAIRPVGAGLIIGILPYVFLNLLPNLFIDRALITSDILAMGFITIPVAFAYSILRYRLLALDALMRRGISTICASAIMVLVFATLWGLLRWLGAGAEVTAGLSAVLAAVSAPTIRARTRAYVEAKLYPQIDPALPGQQLYESGTVDEVASALVRRGRETLPTLAWLACYARTDIDGGSPEAGRWRLTATDGTPPENLPRWSEGNPTGMMPAGTRSMEIEHAGLALGALVLGPHLDGAQASESDIATLASLATRTSVVLEVALRRAQAGRAQLHGRGRSSPQPAAEHGSVLSPRETEIAILIARGLTNRQIATELGIADGTVGKHVEHIMSKLNFQTRSQVAVWAVGQRPVRDS